ncbi:MAG TPA: hypothetical protein VEA79_04535, partial [Phenylobacterium sp.]|nr:hypothetical protein [Phenylobacterium sp.]
MTSRSFALGALAFAAAAGCAPSREAVEAGEAALHADTAVAAAVDSPLRGESNRARDAWRRPRETLGFFGVEPDDTIVEIWPGGGWYTEILAPLVRERGRYVAAGNGGVLGGARALAARDPAAFGHIGYAA